MAVKGVWFVVALCAIVGSSLAVHGQAPAGAENLRIIALGGFLGYEDGLVDPKASSLGDSLGGLYGVRRWLQAQQRRQDLLLITGNNKSLGAGDLQLANLNPDAVAVSIDDFLRALRPQHQAAAFVRWLADGRQPPFVVSNAIVRIHQKKLNRIEVPGFELEVKRDESVGWINSLKVSCRRCPDNMTATIKEDPSGPAENVKSVKTSADKKHLEISLDQYLRPERRYSLTLSKAGVPVEPFVFLTHLPLTRLRGDDAPPALRGLPVQRAVRDLDNAKGASIIILGMVDPDTKTDLGVDRWKWAAQEQPGTHCGGEECEIDFIPALDAFNAISSLAAPADPTQARPVFVLMSGLTDTQTSALVSKAPDIRFVVLDPDSSTLGQDQGDESVVNHAQPKSARIWTRPEWIGQQAEVMSAHMRWERQTLAAQEKPDPSKNFWHMESASIAVEDICGERLDYRLDPRTNQVEYFLKGNPGESLGRPFKPYPPTPKIGAPSAPPGSLWVTAEGTAALILDEVRKSVHADLALLPTRDVDSQIVAWLEAEARLADLDWMSQFILEKLIYQMEHIVTVAVEGSKLADTLDAIVKAEAVGNGKLYAAGLGAEGVLALDKEHLRVNGRVIVPTHVYKIALPQSIAEAQKLHKASGEVASIVQAVETRFMDKEPEPALNAPGLGKVLDDRFSRRPQLYLDLSTAHFEFHKATVKDADGAFATIPLAGRDVKAERQWALSGAGDLAVDYLHVALRLTSDFKYAKKTVDTVSTNPNDEWTAGLRFDGKVERAGIDRVFGGVFKQSWFRDHVEKPITPSRDITDVTLPDGTLVPKVTVSGEAVTPRIEAPYYEFIRLGADFTSKQFTAWFNLKKVAIAYDFGHAYKDRTDVMVFGSEPEDVALYFKSPKTYVNGRFAAQPGLFASPQELTFNYTTRPRPQNRAQADTAVELTLPAAWAHGMKLTNTIQYRYYTKGDRPAYTPDTSVDIQTKLEWTIIDRLKVGPFINLYRVTAKGAVAPYRYLDYGIGVDVPLFISLWKPRVFQ